ncbi:alpha/beta hydrolase [Actinocorallia sp. A-T 12471]|uniref:alpha/beta fold hydrolase n=1 Tax=Actinocorallia sp. A-T 12471 TaxID=3089813 RepID=UPI0029D33D8B|nr:alpha/beta hydrolase [Actinocorallia sp. A-T 12471]MDX6742406.1 alpha/beta hydrolase [Actinocorallia sp. A-T 12471]
MSDVRTRSGPRWHTEPDRVEVGGAELALRRDGAGEPLLYLHGHWLTRCWSPFHARLAERADVIAPEAPGFGDSPCPPWVTDRTDVVLLYRALLDALGLDRVHLAGHGLGAWLAADFAILNPGRVKSLTVLAPFGLRVPGEPIADVFIADPATYDDLYFSGEPVEGVVPGPGTPELGGPEEFAARYGDMGGAARLMWDFRYDLKLERRLPPLGLPALVVTADDDRVVPPAHGARWAELLGARSHALPGGHAFPVQHPERTADLITDFLTEAHDA